MPALFTSTSRPSELLDRGADQSLGAFLRGDVVTVHDRPPAERSDLLGDLLGGADGRPGSVHLGTEVVHDHVGALAGELERVLASDPPSRARDHHDAALAQTAHVSAPSLTDRRDR